MYDEANDLIEATKNARKRGRPSTYSYDTVEVICERLAYGESLRQIRCDESMPSRRAVFQWLAKYPEFARLYAAARHDQIEGLAGAVVEIAESEPDIAQARLSVRRRADARGHARCRRDDARGLEVSLGGLGQDQLVER